MSERQEPDDPEELGQTQECESSAEATSIDDAQEDVGGAEEPSLEQQLADARQAFEETEQKHLYAVADLRNYQRRMQQEMADRMQFANEQLLRDLLPVLDNFQRAVETSPGNADADGVVAGVRMILQQFADLLSSYGVEPVAAEPGTDFDPSVHEAVERLEVAPELRGKVVEEVARGYMFRGRLLRSAKVRAGALAAEEEVAETREEQAAQRPEEAQSGASKKRHGQEAGKEENEAEETN